MCGLVLQTSLVVDLSTLGKKHGGAWSDNKSAFTISKDELKVVLQSPQVVKTPAYQSPTSGNFIRAVDMGRPIGIDAKAGGSLLIS